MTTYYVTKTGNDANSGLSLVLAKLTIASAITASGATDTIQLGVGTWSETCSGLGARRLVGANMLTTIIDGYSQTLVGTSCYAQDMTIKYTAGSLNRNTALVLATRVFFDLTNLTSGFSLYGNAGLTDLRFYNCVIWRATNAGIPFIDSRSTSSVVILDKCTLANCSSTGETFTTNLNVASYMKNCISFFSSGTWRTDTSGIPYQMQIAGGRTYNIFNYAISGSPTLQTGEIWNSVSGAAAFVDLAGGDLRLAANSPGINAGQP